MQFDIEANNHFKLRTNRAQNVRFIKIMLALLIFSINVNGPDFFMTKEIFFAALLVISAPYINYTKITPLIIVCAIYFTSFALNMMIPGSILNATDGFTYVLGLLYVYLLVYSSKEYLNTIIRSYVFSAAIVAFMLVSLWIACYYFDEFRIALMLYSDSFESDKVAFLFMIRERKILDWWFPSVYYGTAPCMIPALGYCLAKKIRNDSKKYTVLSIVFLFALICTGARANIISGIGLYLIYFGIKIYTRKSKILGFIIFLASLILISLFAIAFLSDKGEASLEAKALHVISYQKIFSSDYIRTLFYGWGGGSYFYTEAFNEYVNLSELSLLEMIRRYGLVFSLLIFVSIWLKPLGALIKRRTSFEEKFLMITLLFYIFVASTNPFLLGSIGFAALLFFSVTIGGAFPRMRKSLLHISPVQRGSSVHE
jgi:hypothetical protein